MAVGAAPAGTGDDWDQEASLAATVAQMEADRAAGLIDPDELDELDEDDDFLSFGADWPDEGFARLGDIPNEDFVRLGDDCLGQGPTVTIGEANASAPEHPPVAEGGPAPQHPPVAGGGPAPQHPPVAEGGLSPREQPAPEVLDAGFLVRVRAAGQSGTPPAPAGSPGPGSLPIGNPPVSDPAPGPGPSDSRPGAGFASGEVLDGTRPGPVLAAAAELAAGPNCAYTGVSDDELVGVLTAWQRTESWAAAGRLSAAAELIRRRPATGRARAGHAGVPRPWGRFCADELAAALAISRWAAEKMTGVAHDLATRLPLTRHALHDGIIDAYKAQLIAEATRCLDAAAAAAAEAAIVPDRVTGKTPGQIRAEIARAVLKADPAAARQRREQAQKDARVELWREDAGTAAIVGFGLPPDEALAADQQITSRALDLKAAGVPGGMDALRVRAYLDALLGQDTAARYRTAQRNSPSSDGPISDNASSTTGNRNPGNDGPGNTGPGDHNPRNNSPSNHSTGNNSPGDGSPGRCDSGAPDHGQDGEPDAPAGNRAPGDGAVPEQPSGTGPDGPPPEPIRPAAKINLTIPLATLLGLAEHPGEVTGFGPIDPALARTLAAQATGHPATTYCITVTDPDGHPLAHGCAQPGHRRKKPPRTTPSPRPGPPPCPPSPGSLRPHQLSHHEPGHHEPGHHEPGHHEPGTVPTTTTRPPDGYGSWWLRPPGPGGPESTGGTGGPESTGGTGLPDLTVELEPLPITDCDHRHHTTAHDPGRTLRHLVEIRDGTCSWPPCQRDAARCDFDHTIAWEDGGPTCACNGGPRCRHHHKQKQAAGWALTQPQPGTHTWITPAGRAYTSGPTQYPS
ncbi:MAG: DUF222 domain-containing protein [Streptosporangiaceae bacterium]